MMLEYHPWEDGQFSLELYSEGYESVCESFLEFSN